MFLPLKNTLFPINLEFLTNLISLYSLNLQYYLHHFSYIPLLFVFRQHLHAVLECRAVVLKFTNLTFLDGIKFLAIRDNTFINQHLSCKTAWPSVHARLVERLEHQFAHFLHFLFRNFNNHNIKIINFVTPIWVTFYFIKL